MTRSYSTTQFLISCTASERSPSLLPLSLPLTFATSSPAHPTSVQLSSVEILPSAFPLDATKHFSNVLLPYLRHLLDDPSLARSTGDSEIREALKRATLVEDGKLEKQHEWLYELLEKASVAEKRRKAVVLGAG